ncbi:site-specific integrase [Cyanobacteria bacterium FACHB-472]|nr:site-specific integrase [Cyanobacteria bacterium FACHB-472]
MKEIIPFNNNGSIAIQFQLEGRTYKFSPIKGGKYNNPIDLGRAKAVATQISLDIAQGIFDSTLEKYKVKQTNTELLSRPKGRNTQDAKRDLEEAKQEVALRIISVEIWDKYVEFKRPSVSPSTIAKDFTKVRNYLLKATEVNCLNSTALRSWLLIQTTPGATKKVLVQLSACCNWAVKERLMSLNPFVGMATEIKLPKSAKSKKIEAFTREEENAIIEAFKINRFCSKYDRVKHSYYSPYVEFLFATGCRPSEAIALQWKHISQDFKTITFEQSVVDSERGRILKSGLKTQSERIVPTSNRVQNLLQSIKTEDCKLDSLVFPSPDGTWIDPHNFCNRQWKPILKGLDIPYRKPYCTRHTLITNALDAGYDAKDIAALAGNSAEMIYRNYASINKELRLPDLI